MFPIFLFQHTDKNKDKNPEFQQDQSNNTYLYVNLQTRSKSPFAILRHRHQEVKKYLIYESESSKCQMARIFYESCLRFSQIISRQGHCIQIILYTKETSRNFWTGNFLHERCELVHKYKFIGWNPIISKDVKNITPKYVNFLCSTCIQLTYT